jgi:hypothetical protein
MPNQRARFCKRGHDKDLPNGSYPRGKKLKSGKFATWDGCSVCERAGRVERYFLLQMDKHGKA